MLLYGLFVYKIKRDCLQNDYVVTPNGYSSSGQYQLLLKDLSMGCLIKKDEWVYVLKRERRRRTRVISIFSA